MKSKKAQLLIFVLFVLVIVLGIVVVNFISTEEQPDSQKAFELSQQNVLVKNYVDECIKQAATETAYTFGIQQGFANLREPKLDSDKDVSYYYFEEESFIPEHQRFEEEIAAIMDQKLSELCIDFTSLTQQGYTIVSKPSDTKATILENKVLFDIEYPLLIEKDLQAQLNRFSYELPFRVGHALDVSKKLVDALVAEPGIQDLTLFADQDVAISVFQYDACNQIYILVDGQRGSVDVDPYVHSFAVGFSEQYCVPESDFDFLDESLENSGLEERIIDRILSILQQNE